MKHSCAILLTMFLGLSLPTFLNVALADKNNPPVNISYIKKGQSFLGKKYTLYKVYCADGSQRDISLWEEEKKPWCIGENKKKCGINQLDIAALACQS